MVLELGQSDKALTEDIIRKKPPFVYGYYEWLSTQGTREQITFAEAAQNIRSIFVIPPNKILYVTAINVALRGPDATLTHIAKGTTSSFTIFFSAHTNGAGEVNANASYPIPLEFNHPEEIILEVDAVVAANVEGTVFGFLVDKSII